MRLGRQRRKSAASLSPFGVLYHGSRPQPKKASNLSYHESFDDFQAMEAWNGVRPKDWYYKWERWERLCVLAYLYEKRNLEAAVREYELDKVK